MIFLYPEARCQIEVMTMVMVVSCLTSIWIVFGRGWWLARTCVAMHTLTGIAIETVGHEHFAPIHGQIPAAEIPALLRELRSVQQSRETLASIQAGADLDGVRTLGWRYRLSMVAFDLSAAKPENCYTIVSATTDATEEAMSRRDAAHRLLATELAIRFFSNNYDRNPTALSELVPDILTTLPLDPFGTSPLIYRVGEDGFLLYSVGHDGIDDGGNFGTRADAYRNGYDFDLKTLSRP